MSGQENLAGLYNSTALQSDVHVFIIKVRRCLLQLTWFQTSDCKTVEFSFFYQYIVE